ncbi:MAG: hypothetical protein PHR16_17765 [Methylovulum sp.]|nr:hypothetical protein [Methylovulum sp.]
MMPGTPISNLATIITNGYYVSRTGYVNKVYLDGKGKDLTDVHVYNVDSVYALGTKNETLHLESGTYGSLPGKIDLGAGSNDTLVLSNNDYLLTLKGVETVLGNGSHLSLSGTAAFNTDGSVDTIIGDKYAQLITYNGLSGNSSIDLGRGADKIVLNFDNHLYNCSGHLYAVDSNSGNYLEIDNASGNTSLSIVENGKSLTWAKALATAETHAAINVDINTSYGVAEDINITPCQVASVHFDMNASMYYSDSVDTVNGFKTGIDKIDFSGDTGTPWNYVELDGSGFSTISDAADSVAYETFNGTIGFVMFYNLNGSGNGALIGDQTYGGAPDNMIMITGVSNANGFDYTDLVGNGIIGD